MLIEIMLWAIVESFPSLVQSLVFLLGKSTNSIDQLCWLWWWAILSNEFSFEIIPCSNQTPWFVLQPSPSCTVECYREHSQHQSIIGNIRYLEIIGYLNHLIDMIIRVLIIIPLNGVSFSKCKNFPFNLKWVFSVIAVELLSDQLLLSSWWCIHSSTNVQSVEPFLTLDLNWNLKNLNLKMKDLLLQILRYQKCRTLICSR